MVNKKEGKWKQGSIQVPTAAEEAAKAAMKASLQPNFRMPNPTEEKIKNVVGKVLEQYKAKSSNRDGKLLKADMRGDLSPAEIASVKQNLNNLTKEIKASLQQELSIQGLENTRDLRRAMDVFVSRTSIEESGSKCFNREDTHMMFKTEMEEARPSIMKSRPIIGHQR
jgi:hypothetical protein